MWTHVTLILLFALSQQWMNEIESNKYPFHKIHEWRIRRAWSNDLEMAP